MKHTYIVGNWKMNGSLAANAALLQALCQGVDTSAACTVAVAVPHPYLEQGRTLLSDTPIALAAQDVSQHANGAYTGEVAASMLRDFGVRYVLVGHSERRQYHFETDSVVAAKAQQAQAEGITPIVCVGETLKEREAEQTLAVVTRQLGAVLHTLGAAASQIVVAYEPVWAIGTGHTASPEQAGQVHTALRAQLAQADTGAAQGKVPLLYGGSMNPGNAAQLLAQPDINGGLVGGASLKAQDFLNIVAAATAATSVE